MSNSEKYAKVLYMETTTTKGQSMNEDTKYLLDKAIRSSHSGNCGIGHIEDAILKAWTNREEFDWDTPVTISTEFSNKVKASDFMKFIKVEVKTTEVDACGIVFINGEEIWDVPSWNYMS